MAEFSKAIDMRIIEKLRGEPLFQSWLDEETLADCLLEDMLKGEVFAAIRDGYVEFYCHGQPLYLYWGGVFYAVSQCVFMPQGDKHGYVTETELAGMKHHVRFQDAWEQTKMLCYCWAVNAGVCALYKYSFAAYPCERYFVLDVEIFLGMSLSTCEKIDLLLMDAHTGKLLFCETMNYADTQEVKRIAGQLERYRDRIAEQRDAIIEQYGEYTQTMAALTGIEIPAPTGVCDDCGLLIYGFDEDQKNGRLRKVMDGLTKMGWPVYAVEDIGDVTPETLFKALAGEKG